jgi:predicted RNA-binding protein with PIN domain
MSWIVDGSNLLGAARADAAAKRKLVQALAQFARTKRTRVVCTFDGIEPEHFGTHLGGVSVLFSGTRSADDLIEKRVAGGKGWKVVTSDRGLASRVRRRDVEVVAPAAFFHELQSLEASEERAVTAEDWAAYFADPKNRNIF